MTSNEAVTGAAASDPSPVTGMNIFWPLLTLATACSLHPLGSAVGLPSPFQRYVRTLPLSSLLDTGVLLRQILLPRSWPERSDSLHTAVRSRLQSTLGSLAAHGHPTGGGPASWLFPFVVDINARVLVDFVIVLQYAKLCAFHGIPISFTIASAPTKAILVFFSELLRSIER